MFDKIMVAIRRGDTPQPFDRSNDDRAIQKRDGLNPSVLQHRRRRSRCSYPSSSSLSMLSITRRSTTSNRCGRNDTTATIRFVLLAFLRCAFVRDRSLRWHKKKKQKCRNSSEHRRSARALIYALPSPRLAAATFECNRWGTVACYCSTWSWCWSTLYNMRCCNASAGVQQQHQQQRASFVLVSMERRTCP